MRTGLKKLENQRLRFTAKIERFGFKSAFKGPDKPTVLLKDVRVLSTKAIVTDHLWFTKGKTWEPCQVGDIVEFDARVGVYEKGYKGWNWEAAIENPIETDYRLERPTKLVIQRNQREDEQCLA